MTTLSTAEIIARMGDISDEELGYPDGTLELSAQLILDSGDDPDSMSDDAWWAMVYYAIDTVVSNRCE